jgi:hypothetical protein
VEEQALTDRAAEIRSAPVAPAPRPDIRGFRAVALGGTALALLVQTVSYLSFVFLLDRKAGPLDIDAENNAFSWASSSVTFAAAFVAFVVAGLTPELKRRLRVAAGLLALFSLDDSIELHERIAEYWTIDLPVPDEARTNALWPLAVLPLLLLAFVILLDLSRRVADDARLALRVGLGMLVFGVLAEVAGTLPSRESAAAAILIVLEEGAELGGWMLVLTALTVQACCVLLDVRRPHQFGTRSP